MVFKKIVFWLRNHLPFARKLYLQITLGSIQQYTMWFRVIGINDLGYYTLCNPNHYDTNHEGIASSIGENDRRIQRRAFGKGHDDEILAPSQAYEEILKGCRVSNYYPTQFIQEIKFFVRRA